METAKLTSKGQITIPKEIRRALGLKQGDNIVFIKEDGKYVLDRATNLTIAGNKIKANVEGVIASLSFEGIPVSDEMMTYAEERLSNKTTYDERIKNIKQKYSK